jgi:hypothetical protein
MPSGQEIGDTERLHGSNPGVGAPHLLCYLDCLRRFSYGRVVRTGVERDLGDFGPGGDGVVVVGDPELSPEDLQHRDEGHGAGVGERVGGEDVDASGSAALGELMAQAALPRPGPGHDAHDLPVPSAGLDEGGFEDLHLPVPPNEA